MALIEGFLKLEGRGRYRFSFVAKAPKKFGGIQASDPRYDYFWDIVDRVNDSTKPFAHRNFLYELNSEEARAFRVGWKDAIYETFNRVYSTVIENPNVPFSCRVGGGQIQFVSVGNISEVIENKMENTKIKSGYAVLTFHIIGYKTERDGTRIDVISADDVKSYIGPRTISQTIEDILRQHDLVGSDIISISADYTKEHDAGSWDFWMFCRNPNSAIDAMKKAGNGTQ